MCIRSLLFTGIIFLSTLLLNAQQLTTPFEKDSLQSATYAEAIGFYKMLAGRYPQQLQLREIGPTEHARPSLPQLGMVKRFKETTYI